MDIARRGADLGIGITVERFADEVDEPRFTLEGGQERDRVASAGCGRLLGLWRCGTLFGLVDLKDTMSMYYFVLVIFLFGFWMVYRTINSPFGQVLKAIRENEPRARLSSMRMLFLSISPSKIVTGTVRNA